MKTITLLNGEIVKVDSRDYKWLSDFTWYLGNGYAYASINGSVLSMHSLIMKTPKGMHTHHINEDKLDNRRRNLKVLTVKEHFKSRRPYKGEGNPFFGKKHKEVSKQSIALTQSNPVCQYTMYSIFVAVYPSIIEAERQTGISNGNISSVCSGKRKTAGGYIWKFERHQ